MAQLFIQFMHPGPEPARRGRQIDGNKCIWNQTNHHKRKYIRHLVRCWDGGTGETDPAEMGFWGEWEADSTFEVTGRKSPYPITHHRIVLLIRHPRACKMHQNTDPFVFGDRFVYTICQQEYKNCLRDLDPGSIIAFGSRVDGHFGLDTLFVVGDIRVELDLERETWREVLDSEVYKNITIWPLTGKNGRCKPKKYKATVYGGVMFGNRTQSNPMFSFIPCSLGPFPRPTLGSLMNKGLITDTLTQGIKRTRLSSVEESIKIWEMVYSDVKAAGLRIATRVVMP